MTYCFFSMTRPPPTSTLFPSTPLFRSPQMIEILRAIAGTPASAIVRLPWNDVVRSEEHTSELQSHRYKLYDVLFFFNDPPPTDFYPLSLHAALPIPGDDRDLARDRGHAGVRYRAAAVERRR